MIAKVPNTNNTLQIQSLFPQKVTSGPKVNTTGVAPVETNNKKAALNNGKKTLNQAKQSTPAIKANQQKINELKPFVGNADGQNYSILRTAFEQTNSDISGFQASLGNGGSSEAGFKFDGGTTPAFDFGKAQESLNTSAFQFSDTLLGSTETAKSETETAKSLGSDASDALSQAGDMLGGGLGGIATGSGLVTTGITTLVATGWTGFGSIAAAAQIGTGVMQIGGGFMEVTRGQQESQNAETTGENATQNYELAAQKLGETGANLDQLEEFYKSINAQAFPVLNQAQRGNDNLFTLGASLGANVPAPATSAPSSVADASWTTPATTTTGDIAQAGGSTAPTALGVQAPLAGGNTAPEPPQAGGLTDAEKRWMSMFEKAPSEVASANAQATTALSSAPQGLDTAPIAQTAKVEDASQFPPLQDLYARLKEKEAQAQAQAKNQQPQGLGTAFIGNGVNPQDPTVVAQAPQDPNAPQAQGQQAPGGTPATPASTATAPTRTLTIPNFAPVAPIQQPAVA
jgi:hypothetical protein